LTDSDRRRDIERPTLAESIKIAVENTIETTIENASEHAIVTAERRSA
jgi:hypothetical protein